VQIALKSELAGRLAHTAPERAAAEIRDVEDAARTALHEVREAVAGYRLPTLASELRAAEEILAAAGIRYTQAGEAPALPAPVEAVLSWTVREGVTNAEIADALALSEGTVRNYLSVAIQKLGAHNRVEAARIAEEKGWL
jgi:two-component system sensor histidine kinase DesK